MQGRVRRLLNGTKPEKPHEDAREKRPEATQEPVRKESAITEISDEDYRSFCYPCYALEDVQDRKGGN
jgi:hypothetical protein